MSSVNEVLQRQSLAIQVNVFWFAVRSVCKKTFDIGRIKRQVIYQPLVKGGLSFPCFKRL